MMPSRSLQTILFYLIFLAFIGCSEEPNPVVSTLGNKPENKHLDVVSGPSELEKIGKRYTDCKNIEQIFRNTPKYKITSEQMRKKYVLKRELADAHSGSKIFLVSSVMLPSFEAIMKTMPAKKVDLADNENFREMYYLCKLQNLTSKYYLPKNLDASIFFPKLYSVGMLDSLNPFNIHSVVSSDGILYMIMEYIEGMSFIDFIEKPERAKEIFGFDIDTAPKDFLKGILFQLAVALFNADYVLGFRHTDLHPGNIMIAKEKISISTEINGRSIRYEGPLIKLIDFGQSFGKDYDQSTLRKLAHKPLKAREVRLMDHELNSNSSLLKKQASRAAMVANLSSYVLDRDIRSLNFYLQVFEQRLKKLGISTIRFCNTYQDCLDLISSWYQFL